MLFGAARIFSGALLWLLSALWATASAQDHTCYAYDELGRLVEAEYSDGSRLAYSYDSQDNRVQLAQDLSGVAACSAPVVPTHFPGAPESAPTAVDDTASVASSGSITINVLANDDDVNGDTLSIDSVTQPSSGSATIVDADTKIRYDADQVPGDYSFTYTVSDGNGGIDTATVTVTVPNDPPVASPNAASVYDSQSVTIPVLVDDSDPNGDPLSITSVTQPSKGSATIVDSNTRIRFDASRYAGDYTFNYTVSDGRGGSDTATVTVSVIPAPNYPPVAQDDSASVEVSQSVTLYVVTNDFDPDDGDTLSISSVTQPSQGSATKVNNSSIRFDAGPNAGTFSFNYTVSDGNGGSDTATVTVTVTEPPNAAPSAGNDSASVEVSQSVTISVLANDSDLDGDPLTISSLTQPSSGSATRVNSNTKIRFDAGSSAGTYSFNYTVSDGNGGSDTATVNVTVSEPANNAPVASNDSASVFQGDIVVIWVLANDSDPDGDTLTVTNVGQVSSGSASISNSGQSVTYQAYPSTPAGYQSFNYTISDGNGGTDTGTVTVQVQSSGGIFQ